jgi:DNA (cytosine-5)-methyltransferase 1
MRVLSLFSGIEAASVAFLPLGWELVGFSEIEPFPCAVLAHHYPDVPNLGDVSKITREQIAALGHIDMVCGGFPCQDLSVAGRRAGLKNDDGSKTRSGLFFDAMRVVEWAGPRWLLIENVPGMLSSNRGRDFAAVVGEMAGCGFDVPADGWGNTGVALGPGGLVEWATLDAQWFGLAQRRKRVFLVRDSGDWASRPPVLLERASLSGHPAPRLAAAAGTSTDKPETKPTLPSLTA